MRPSIKLATAQNRATGYRIQRVPRLLSETALAS